MARNQKAIEEFERQVKSKAIVDLNQFPWTYQGARQRIQKLPQELINSRKFILPGRKDPKVLRITSKVSTSLQKKAPETLTRETIQEWLKENDLPTLEQIAHLKLTLKRNQRLEKVGEENTSLIDKVTERDLIIREKDSTIKHLESKLSVAKSETVEVEKLLDIESFVKEFIQKATGICRCGGKISKLDISANGRDVVGFCDKCKKPSVKDIKTMDGLVFKFD